MNKHTVFQPSAAESMVIGHGRKQGPRRDCVFVAHWTSEPRSSEVGKPTTKGPRKYVSAVQEEIIPSFSSSSWMAKFRGLEGSGTNAENWTAIGSSKRARTSVAQTRAFAIIGPSLWNQLLPSSFYEIHFITGQPSTSFRSLKTALFSVGLSHWKRF